MTAQTKYYPIATSPTIGVNLNSTYAGTTTDGENAPYALGTTVLGSDGGQYTLVQAGAAISTTTSQPFCIAMDGAWQANKITKALASAAKTIGFAPQLVISDNDFFWARMRGSHCNIKVAVSCAADVNLWTTATAGVLDDTSGGSHVVVLGVRLATAASASVSAESTVRAAVITYPLNPGLIA